MSIKFVVKTGEKYKDRNGQEKTFWRQIGKIIQSEKGYSVKIDAFPVQWDGWAYLFDPEEREQKQAEQKAAPADDPNDTIPF